MTNQPIQNRAARRGRDPLTLVTRGLPVLNGFRVSAQSEKPTPMVEDKQPRNPFLDALDGLIPTPTTTDASLPPCPCCQAPALAGYAYAAWNDVAHNCDCVIEREQGYLHGLRRLWQQRNAHPHYIGTLPDRYRAYTLDTLRLTPANTAALKAARAGLTGNLYLFGPAGTGKSHLAAAAAAHLAQQGKTARFWGMASLFAALRSSFSGEAQRPELLHWDVLVLDDIDKLKPTPYVYETVYALLEERWARQKVTIFTAQLNPDRAARVLTPEGNELAADPLASRLASGVVAKIEGADGRFGVDGGGAA